MAGAARVPITNLCMDGEYAATIRVGPGQKPLTVILDTGSSALALDASKYSPAAGDRTTRLAQTVGYGGRGWTGAVIQTDISIGSGTGSVTVSGANTALAYQTTPKVFGRADGVLGLAYAALDGARAMPADTWAARYPDTQVKLGVSTPMAPYLTQLAGEGVASDVIAFFTRRSAIHHGGGTADPLNRGWMIVGGGEECADLYTGAFQTVKVLADAWWNTNLKAVVVGNGPAIPIPPGGVAPVPSNSIIDSGDPSLTFGPDLLDQVLANFSATQQAQLKASMAGEAVAASSLELAAWPTLGFILEGDAGDVTLAIPPGDYWQVNAPKIGQAKAALNGGGVNGLVVLGLPLMNGYFTIFDGEADGGRGAIRFAASVR